MTGRRRSSVAKVIDEEQEDLGEVEEVDEKKKSIGSNNGLCEVKEKVGGIAKFNILDDDVAKGLFKKIQIKT